MLLPSNETSNTSISTDLQWEYRLFLFSCGSGLSAEEPQVVDTNQPMEDTEQHRLECELFPWEKQSLAAAGAHGVAGGVLGHPRALCTRVSA